MAKLGVAMVAVAAALLFLAATIANASSSSYTVTTRVVEDGDRMMKMNSKKIKQGEEEYYCGEQGQYYLRHCGQFLFDESMGGGQYYLGRAISMKTKKKNQVPQHFYECCGELWSIQDQQCICQSLESLTSSGGRGGGGGQQSEQFVMSTASVLPLFCGLGHTCDFQSSYGPQV